METAILPSCVNTVVAGHSRIKGFTLTVSALCLAAVRSVWFQGWSLSDYKYALECVSAVLMLMCFLSHNLKL